jgi:hypothetical protein
MSGNNTPAFDLSFLLAAMLSFDEHASLFDSSKSALRAGRAPRIIGVAGVDRESSSKISYSRPRMPSRDTCEGPKIPLSRASGKKGRNDSFKLVLAGSFGFSGGRI